MLIIRNTFLSWFRVKGHLVAPLVFCALMFSIEGMFWISLSGEHHQLGSYSLNQLLFYVFGALIASQITAVSGEPDQLSARIESGQLETFLVRPISVFYQLLLIQLGLTFARLSFFVPMIIGLQILFLKGVSASGLIHFVLFITMASMINFFIHFWISSLTFYFRDAYAFVIFKETLWWIVSGALIPLDLFPEAVRNLLWVLPSAFVVFHPVKVLNGSVTEMSTLFIWGCLWLVFLALLAEGFWKLGIRKYQAYGS